MVRTVQNQHATLLWRNFNAELSTEVGDIPPILLSYNAFVNAFWDGISWNTFDRNFHKWKVQNQSEYACVYWGLFDYKIFWRKRHKWKI